MYIYVYTSNTEQQATAAAAGRGGGDCRFVLPVMLLPYFLFFPEEGIVGALERDCQKFRVTTLDMKIHRIKFGVFKKQNNFPPRLSRRT